LFGATRYEKLNRDPTVWVYALKSGPRVKDGERRANGAPEKIGYRTCFA